MLSRSCSILTRGRIAKNAITYITSGYVLLIEEIYPPIINPNQGGKSGYKKQDEYKKKTIRITLFVNNEKYTQIKSINKDIKVTKDNVLIE